MKKDILLLHGAVGSSSQFQPLAEELVDTFNVHSPDLPGHGGSMMPDRFSISVFAEFVEQYCASRGMANLPVFGYSMGGYIAMFLARQKQDRFSRIITLATKFHWDGATAAKEIKMLQPELIEQKVPQFASTLQQRHAPNDWADVLRRTGSMLSEMGSQNPLSVKDYTHIKTPSLVMIGDRDKMVTLAETIEVYQALPDAQLAILPGTPHPIEGVDPRLLSMHIKRFLE